MRQLPCQVVAAVPREAAEAAAHAAGADPRRHPAFISYAMAAAAEVRSSVCAKTVSTRAATRPPTCTPHAAHTHAQALADAGWRPSTPAQQAATGVSLGAGMSCITEVAEAGALITSDKLRRLSPYFVPRILINMAAGAVSIAHALQGPNHAVSTACATGVHCIGDAFRMVQRGDAQVMVAGAARRADAGTRRARLRALACSCSARACMCGAVRAHVRAPVNLTVLDTAALRRARAPPGATEACIDAISLGGFCRLKALSTGFNDQPHEASRPFDARRDGFVMGEGAAVLVLEELAHAQARGASAYAEVCALVPVCARLSSWWGGGRGVCLCRGVVRQWRQQLPAQCLRAANHTNTHTHTQVRGYGMSGDAHHITAPHPDGRGAALAMQRALHGAGVPPSAVAYINAHATSTPVGDEIEQAAIQGVFGGGEAGGGAARSVQVRVSSTKGATGHLLGAAGAVEAAFTVLALHHRTAPATCNLAAPEPQLLPGLVRGAPARLPGGPLGVMCNSFGFGGTNASIVFASPPV
jgi:3-oxoacyl-[acyl-carrier-protein] synthase II